METEQARGLAQEMLAAAHFSARVSAADREALLAPVAAHVTSLPEPEDHLAIPRVSGAGLLTVTGNLLYDTGLREHDPGVVQTAGYRLDDEATVVALDSQPAGTGAGRRTVWHFRFRAGGTVEIVGEIFAEPHADTGATDAAEAFARRLSARVGRRVG